MNTSKEIYLKYVFYLTVLALVLLISVLRDFNYVNELRYLSIADEALANGSYFVFSNHSVPYADKPPLYFWFIMLGKVLFGQHYAWYIILFSIIPALIVLITMDKWTKNEITFFPQLSAKLQLVTAVFFMGSAIILRMDMLMCMFIILSLYTFFKMYNKTNTKYDIWLLPFYIFLGVFSKGPIGILIPVLSITIFLISQKKIKSIFKYFGYQTLIVLAIGFIVWFTCVWLEAGNEYLYNLLFNQTVNRSVNSFAHKEPFYFYGLTIWYELAPWSLLLLVAFIIGLKNKLLKTDLEKFYAVIILTSLIFLSLVSSKFEIYLLPILPVIVYLAVILISKIQWHRGLAITLGILPVGAIAALPAYWAFIAVAKKNAQNALLFDAYPYFSATLICNMVFSIFALLYLIKQRNILKSSCIIAAGIICAIFIFSLSIPPYLNNIIGYRNVTQKAKSITQLNHFITYYSFGVRRSENMDIYLGQPVIQIMNPEDILVDNKSQIIIFINTRKLYKNEALQDYIKNMKISTVGEISIVEVN